MPFRNIKEFTGAFKREFGVSPAEWRHPRLRKTKEAPAMGSPPAPACEVDSVQIAAKVL